MNLAPEKTGSGDLPDRNSLLPILFYDSRCILCQKSVRWIIQHDPEAIFSFAGLDSKAATARIPDDHPFRKQDTVILSDAGGLYSRSSAVFRVLRKLPTAWRILLLFSILPRDWTDWGYRKIADCRYSWFGTDDSCSLPDPAEKDRFLD